MIASFQHNFIFIKTRKTAGTSIEMALSRLCGPEDIIAPISFADERARGIHLQNASPVLDGLLRAAAADGDEMEYARLTGRLSTNSGFFNHMPAHMVRARLPEAFWDKAFKFTVERHPYEKAISAAYYRNRHGTAESFANALEETIQHRLFEDSHQYTIEGRVVVDRIVRYEDLETDLPAVFEELGLEMPALPRAKGNFRRDRRPAADILSAEQKAKIFMLARSTFGLMDYRP